MLGGADALGYSVRVAARSRSRRHAWGTQARPWLYLEVTPTLAALLGVTLPEAVRRRPLGDARDRADSS